MRPQHNADGHQRRQAPLQAAWRADADKGPHQESQIEATDMDEEPLQDVCVAPEMCPSHAAGLVEMRVGPFQAFTPSPQQGESPCAVNAPTIRIHRGLGSGLLLPVASTAVRFGNVGRSTMRGPG